MKKANKQVKKGGISAMNKMKEKSSFMLVTSGVQSFNATQQKKTKTTEFSCPETGIVQDHSFSRRSYTLHLFFNCFIH